MPDIDKPTTFVRLFVEDKVTLKMSLELLVTVGLTKTEDFLPMTEVSKH